VTLLSSAFLGREIVAPAIALALANCGPFWPRQVRHDAAQRLPILRVHSARPVPRPPGLLAAVLREHRAVLVDWVLEQSKPPVEAAMVGFVAENHGFLVLDWLVLVASSSRMVMTPESWGHL